MEKNEGYIAVTVLLIMALLSVVGISATTTATLEMQIAANEKKYKQQFYLAETAAMEGVRILEAVDIQKLLAGEVKGYAGEIGPRFKNIWQRIEHWEATGDDSDSAFAIVYRGLAPGNSVEMQSTAERHNYTVIGRSGGENARVIVEVGYWKQF